MLQLYLYMYIYIYDYIYIHIYVWSWTCKKGIVIHFFQLLMRCVCIVAIVVMLSCALPLGTGMLSIKVMLLIYSQQTDQERHGKTGQQHVSISLITIPLNIQILIVLDSHWRGGPAQWFRPHLDVWDAAESCCPHRHSGARRWCWAWCVESDSVFGEVAEIRVSCLLDTQNCSNVYSTIWQYMIILLLYIFHVGCGQCLVSLVSRLFVQRASVTSAVHWWGACGAKSMI